MADVRKVYELDNYKMYLFYFLQKNEIKIKTTCSSALIVINLFCHGCKILFRDLRSTTHFSDTVGQRKWQNTWTRGPGI